MNFIPNIEPKIFSLSAIAVGYILIDDLTANEQNALGNWLMLTAQVLCTNAFYKQVLQEREQNNQYHNEKNTPTEVELLKKMVDAINKEVETLKSSN